MTAKRTKSKAAPTVQDFDREFRAQIGQMTGGLAPAAFSNAWADWATHLACSPASSSNCSSMRPIACRTRWPSRCAR